MKTHVATPRPPTACSTFAEVANFGDWRARDPTRGRFVVEAPFCRSIICDILPRHSHSPQPDSAHHSRIVFKPHLIDIGRLSSFGRRLDHIQSSHVADKLVTNSSKRYMMHRDGDVQLVVNRLSSNCVDTDSSRRVGGGEMPTARVSSPPPRPQHASSCSGRLR